MCCLPCPMGSPKHFRLFEAYWKPGHDEGNLCVTLDLGGETAWSRRRDSCAVRRDHSAGCRRSRNHPSARQPGGVHRSRTVVVVAPLFAVRVVVVRSISAPPSAPASIRANDSNVRIAPARVLACRRTPAATAGWIGTYPRPTHRRSAGPADVSQVFPGGENTVVRRGGLGTESAATRRHGKPTTRRIRRARPLRCLRRTGFVHGPPRQSGRGSGVRHPSW